MPVVKGNFSYFSENALERFKKKCEKERILSEIKKSIIKNQA
jgi:ribosomal protein S21